MVLFDSRTGVEVIERRECLALLGVEQVGRLAILEGGEPLILPVNYALDGESIVFRTGEGSKLDAARGEAASFEIDGIDPERRAGWSVVVRGNLHLVTVHDRPALERLSGQVEPWIGERPHLVRLQAQSITGRRLRGSETAPAS